MSAPRPRTRIAVLVLALASFLAVAALLNLARGAFASGFGAFDDEPAHLVTGLMLRDWLAAGLPAPPVEWAREYYLHYPKVAAGQWPPGLHVSIALWTLAWGDSRAALVLLASALAAATATAVFAFARRDLPAPGAWALGMLFLLLPPVQRLGAGLMTEVPVALFALLASLALARLLAGGDDRRAATAFAMCSSLAILTKGNAWALALVPPLAALLGGFGRALRRPAPWIAAAAVAAACLPWYLATMEIPRSTWVGGPEPLRLDFAAAGLAFYPPRLLDLGGVAVAACALLGTVCRPRDPERRARWAVLASFPPVLLLVHLVVPSSLEARHLVVLAPQWILLAGHGVAELARRVGRLPVGAAPFLLAAAFGLEAFEVPPKRELGHGRAVRAILADPALDGSVLLVASDARGEGLFVGELALAEERPGHVCLRASKVLATSSWTGRDYEERFPSAEGMRRFLREVPVGVVALDLAGIDERPFPHHAVLRGVVEERPDVWEPLARFDVVRDGRRFPEALRLFRQRGHEALPHRPLSFDDVRGTRELPRLLGG